MLLSERYPILWQKKSNIIWASLISILFSSITLLLVYLEYAVFLAPALIVFPFLYFIITKPKVWLFGLAIMSGIFFQSAGEGISIIDVVTGAYLLGSVIIWFAFKLIFKREKVVRNYGDLLILAFFLAMPLNLAITIFHEADTEIWIREFLMMFVMLLYFPIRDSIKSERDMKYFLSIIAIVIIGVGLYQLYDYYIRVTVKMVYAYELIHAMNVNQTLFTSSAVVGLIFLITADNLKVRIVSLIFAALSVIFLFSTFSRTFWLILLLTIFAMFLIVPGEKKIRLSLYVGIIVTFIGIAAMLFMRDNVMILYEVSKKRLLSATKAGQDISLRSRLIEWEKVTDYIKQYPLGGNGLGKQYHFYDPITMVTKRTDIIHNGYLYLIYRIGIPLSLFYFGFLFFYLFKAINLIPKARSDFQKSIAYSIIGLFLTLFIANYTSSQFFYRDGLFVTAMVISFICILENLIISNIISQNGS